MIFNSDKIKSLERQIADMKKHKESKKVEPSPKESSQTVSYRSEMILLNFPAGRPRHLFAVNRLRLFFKIFNDTGLGYILIHCKSTSMNFV